MNLDRRKFLTTGAAGSLAAAGAAFGKADGDGAFAKTPSEVEGPFYPIVAQKDKDFDLTQIAGRKGVAEGRQVIIEGTVHDTEGNPVEDATVDLWQANAAGRYRHPHDSNPAPLDNNFEGWAIVLTGRKGTFRFKTIVPGSYPAAEGWQRPPHIHFKVTKKGYLELTTQMYFPGEALNESDLLLKRKSDAEKALMIATASPEEPDILHFPLVIEKV